MDDMSGIYLDVEFEVDEPYLDVELEGGGTVKENDHNKLINRDLADQHPISAISGLLGELDEKLEYVPALSNLEIETLINNFV